MIRFRTAEAAKSAALLGFSEQDLLFCIQHPDINECRRRLEELKARVKKTYKTCALELHPDRTKDDPEKTELFKHVARMWSEIEQLQIGRAAPPPPITIIINGAVTGYATSSSGTGATTATTATSWGGWKVWE